MTCFPGMDLALDCADKALCVPALTKQELRYEGMIGLQTGKTETPNNPRGRKHTETLGSVR